jgi:hypothetical protein
MLLGKLLLLIMLMVFTPLPTTTIICPVGGASERMGNMLFIAGWLLNQKATPVYINYNTMAR